MLSLCTKLGRKVRGFFSSESGATAIEYGLIAALISVVIIASITAVGSALTHTFTAVASAVSAATPTAS
jgi:pilus assembly protein Flp/PilA